MKFTTELSKEEIEIITERQLFRMNWINNGMDKTEPIDFVLQKILDAASASQPAVEADAESRCPKCGEPEPVLCCENCGHKWSRTV